MLPIMRTMALLILAAAALRMPVSAAEDKTPPAEKLIEQLGSDDFAQRERAARLLQARGPAVLPALRKARNHRDAEVRRRVREMIPILETTAALVPKRVTLGREPQTLSAILKEIEKQTGYKIKAEDAGAEEYCSFEMKGVPFWEAMERIGRQTGRVVNAVVVNELRLDPREARSPFVAFNGPFRLEVLRIHEDRDIDFTEPGKGKEQGSRDHRLKLTISVRAEPPFIFAAGQGQVRVATDEDGKQLEAPAPLKQENGIAFARTFEKHFVQTSEIVLQRPSLKTTTIKLLRGTIPVQVVAKRKRVVFTDNILKAQGVTCRVREGDLRITEIKRSKNGEMGIEIHVPPAPEITASHWYERIHVEDAMGHRYKPYSQGARSLGSQTVSISLGYPASNDAKVGPPSRVLVEDWTLLHYAIPFEFKDVPLP